MKAVIGNWGQTQEDYLDSCHEIQGIFGNGQLALHSRDQELDSQACCPTDRR